MDKVIVFIDAECVLCDVLSRLIIRTDKNDLFRIASLTGQTYGKLSQNPQPNDDLKYVEVYNKGQWFAGPEAIFEIVRLLGFPFTLLLVFTYFPEKVVWKVYRFISKKRYLWFGKRSSCSLESSQNLKKILP